VFAKEVLYWCVFFFGRSWWSLWFGCFIWSKSFLHILSLWSLRDSNLVVVRALWYSLSGNMIRRARSWIFSSDLSCSLVRPLYYIKVLASVHDIIEIDMSVTLWYCFLSDKHIMWKLASMSCITRSVKDYFELNVVHPKGCMLQAVSTFLDLM